MKIGICLASFPAGMDYREMFKVARDAGFDGIEPGLASEGPVSLKSSRDDLLRFREEAEKAGLEIPSLSCGLLWKTPLTSDDEGVRSQALKIARFQLEAARTLGAETVLVIPGVVHAFFVENCPVVSYEAAYERALKAFKELAPRAEELNVHIGVENVWNKFLLSPLEMARFVDEVGSSHLGVYFDIGNVIPFGFPQDWIQILGKRIKKVHAKDFKRDASIESMSIGALEQIGYDDYITAEMIPLYRHHPLQRIYNTAASLRAILGVGKEKGRW